MAAIECEERGEYLACGILPAVVQQNLRGIRKALGHSRSGMRYRHTEGIYRWVPEPGGHLRWGRAQSKDLGLVGATERAGRACGIILVGAARRPF